MEIICLVEAGNYFLGIDAAVITRKQDVYSFLDEEWALVGKSRFFYIYAEDYDGYTDFRRFDK